MRSVALAVLGTSGCIFGSSGPPEDSCDDSSGGNATALELGTSDEPFTPLEECARAPFVRGGQGATMIGVRLRLRGAVPSCLAQHTEVTEPSGKLIGRSTSAVNTYAGDGVRTTKPVWIPGAFDSADLLVTVKAAGQTVTRRLSAWSCDSRLTHCFGGGAADPTCDPDALCSPALRSLLACQHDACGNDARCRSDPRGVGCDDCREATIVYPCATDEPTCGRCVELYRACQKE